LDYDCSAELLNVSSCATILLEKLCNELVDKHVQKII